MTSLAGLSLAELTLRLRTVESLLAPTSTLPDEYRPGLRRLRSRLLAAIRVHEDELAGRAVVVAGRG